MLQSVRIPCADAAEQARIAAKLTELLNELRPGPDPLIAVIECSREQRFFTNMGERGSPGRPSRILTIGVNVLSIGRGQATPAVCGVSELSGSHTFFVPPTVSEWLQRDLEYAFHE